MKLLPALAVTFACLLPLVAQAEERGAPGLEPARTSLQQHFTSAEGTPFVAEAVQEADDYGLGSPSWAATTATSGAPSAPPQSLREMPASTYVPPTPEGHVPSLVVPVRAARGPPARG